MKINNANDCPYWYGDNCECGYLKDCKLNKQEAMNFSDIKQFKVDKGIGVPGTIRVSEDTSPELMAEFRKQFTCATNAPDGVYDADRFEQPVWQYMGEDPVWKIMPSKFIYNADYLIFKKHMNEAPKKIETRQFLSLKLSPENKQDFGEWISVEQLIDSEFFDVMQDVAKHQRYIAYPLENLLANGYDSQNVGKALRELGVDDKACLWFHKLIFACEGLVKNVNFKKLEERRVELVCAKYRDKISSPPKSI